MKFDCGCSLKLLDGLKIEMTYCQLHSSAAILQEQLSRVTQELKYLNKRSRLKPGKITRDALIVESECLLSLIADAQAAEAAVSP